MNAATENPLAILTAERLAAEVRAVAEERPDYKPQHSCMYRYEDGSPCCIVGPAFARLEVLNEVTPTKRMNEKRIDHLLSVFGVEYDNHCRWISDVQSNQDQGLSWGESVAAADKRRGRQ